MGRRKYLQSKTIIFIFIMQTFKISSRKKQNTIIEKKTRDSEYLLISKLRQL
jgi:hypothetical protein